MIYQTQLNKKFRYRGRVHETSKSPPHDLQQGDNRHRRNNLTNYDRAQKVNIEIIVPLQLLFPPVPNE